MKQFELWLDESGDFKTESELNKNPSLVGGVLVEKGALSEKDIRGILNKDYVHRNEIRREVFGDYATKVLKDICDYGGKLIIFENEERIQVVDGSTTYLNILSEGIKKVIQRKILFYGI